MKIKEIIKKLDLKILAADAIDEKTNDATGCYISDLLSLAMSRVGAGNIWITVQTNINIVAVASLTDANCIIVPEGIGVDESVLKKANSQDIVILSSNDKAYELAVKLNDLI